MLMFFSQRLQDIIPAVSDGDFARETVKFKNYPPPEFGPKKRFEQPMNRMDLNQRTERADRRKS